MSEHVPTEAVARVHAPLSKVLLAPTTARAIGLVWWARIQTMLSSLRQERTTGPGLPMIIGVHYKGCGLIVAATVVS